MRMIGADIGLGCGVPGRFMMPESRVVPGACGGVGCIDWLNGRWQVFRIDAGISSSVGGAIGVRVNGSSALATSIGV